MPTIKYRRFKMATFFNQATLSYNGNIVNSNVAQGEIVDTLAATKTAISTSYAAGDGVAYAISIVNNGTSEATGITVTDDLGTFTSGTLTITTLDYVDGTVKYYQNGVLQPTPAVTAGPPLTVSGITVPAGGNALIIYEAEPNGFADFTAGSGLTNTATVVGDGIDATVTATVPAREEANLSITKSVSPDEVTNNGQLTYTFLIQNTGNTATVATDEVVITDTFNPILSGLTVTYNGTPWAEGTNYTYNEATGLFATVAGEITVPAATYTRDAATGAVTITPGTAVVTVTGTV